MTAPMASDALRSRSSAASSMGLGVMVSWRFTKNVLRVARCVKTRHAQDRNHIHIFLIRPELAETKRLRRHHAKYNHEVGNPRRRRRAWLFPWRSIWGS